MQKPIMIVGEYWNEDEELSGKPFAGAGAGVLHGLLQQAGIAARDCHFTNALNLRPPGNRLENLCTNKAGGVPGYRAVFGSKYLSAEYEPELERLHEELNRIQPNVILALGNVALWALAKKSGIKKYRGSPMLTHDGRFKLIPSWPPTSILSAWNLRVVALSDFAKARSEAAFPELRRTPREIWLEPTLHDIETFYSLHIKDAAFLSCDIETKQRTITEVGYATPSGRCAIVIPFYSRLVSDGNYWNTFSEERQAWKWVRRINAEKPLIGQNFAYDMSYFWRTVGMPTPQFAGDTMLMHHALHPELEKGLGFLGSVYTNEPSWKMLRTTQDTLKKGDE